MPEIEGLLKKKVNVIKTEKHQHRWEPSYINTADELLFKCSCNEALTVNEVCEVLNKYYR